MAESPKQYHFRTPDGKTTTFAASEERVDLERLFGLSSRLSESQVLHMRPHRFFALETDLGSSDADQPNLHAAVFSDTDVKLTWMLYGGKLELSSEWSFCTVTGVVSRKDKIKNVSPFPVQVDRCLSRFIFAPDEYELYSQSSLWCLENEGAWEKFSHGERIFTCKGGRTTQGGTPFMAIRNRENEGIAFHIVPQGNWVIKWRAVSFENVQMPYPLLEMGLSDGHLHRTLSPDEEFALPEILIHSLSGREEHGATARFHHYVLRHLIPAPKQLPIVYNTWFYDFEYFTVDALRKQLAAAKKIGCDTFVIDAGWFGDPRTTWWDKTGDWNELPEGPFAGRMADFADEVRREGLAFGLWIEPERISSKSSVFKAHPDWFKPGHQGHYPDLDNPEVYAYLFGEIARLVETYRLTWMKVDFNAELGIDDTGSEYDSYYGQWYRLFDELKSKYPHMFFEGCASGGMRLDLNSLRHFHGHFMTDTVNPTDVLRISQGAMLRLPPGLLTKWAVYRGAGKNIPQYGMPVSETEDQVVAPSGAGWDGAVVHDPHFITRANMVGMLAFSGDLASVSDAVLAKIKKDVDFYKEWNAFIMGSTAHLLTPPRNKAARDGWVVFQLENPARPEKLLFVYRLDDPQTEKTIRLKNLDAEKSYTVQSIDDMEGKSVLSGETLMMDGLQAVLPRKSTSSIYIVS